MTSHALRVLVAEDSPTARQLLVEILRADAGLAVVGEARNGLEAVEMTARLRPDVVTMDIRMPVMDGFEATRQIMVDTPTPIVIISAAYDEHDVEVAMHALRMGALTVLPKPPGPESAAFDGTARRLVQTVKAMAGVKVVRRWRDRPAPAPAPRSRRRTRVRVVAMAASTGGPAAIARILGEMPADFSVPVLVVQHIAAGFVDGLAAWLNTSSPLPVKVAADGEPLQPGRVYLAPDDHHLGLASASMLAIRDTPHAGGFRPSASALFESVAGVFGNTAVGVILTGMGDDGVVGLRAIRQAGGRIIAQDEETSIVFGMPGVAIAEGLADETLPLDAIAVRLQELTTHGR